MSGLLTAAAFSAALDDAGVAPDPCTPESAPWDLPPVVFRVERGLWRLELAWAIDWALPPDAPMDEDARRAARARIDVEPDVAAAASALGWSCGDDGWAAPSWDSREDDDDVPSRIDAPRGHEFWEMREAFATRLRDAVNTNYLDLERDRLRLNTEFFDLYVSTGGERGRIERGWALIDKAWRAVRARAVTVDDLTRPNLARILRIQGIRALRGGCGFDRRFLRKYRIEAAVWGSVAASLVDVPCDSVPDRILRAGASVCAASRLDVARSLGRERAVQSSEYLSLAAHFEREAAACLADVGDRPACACDPSHVCDCAPTRSGACARWRHSPGVAIPEQSDDPALRPSWAVNLEDLPALF